MKDAEILRTALVDMGYSCDIVPYSDPSGKFAFLARTLWALLQKFHLLYAYKQVVTLLFGKSNTYALHLELIEFPKLFRHEQHILIPNQECFRPRQLELLQNLNNIWCKTKVSLDVFSQLNCKVCYIGFCSNIPLGYEKESKHRDYFLSRSGNSIYRGSEKLISVWNRHPEWPTLKIIIPEKYRPPIQPSNVEYLDTFTSQNEYYLLASRSQFQIYLTETEGFGHSIVEAMGYGSIVLVTNAPPMNEIATDKNALLVDADYAGQLCLSPRFSARDEAIEKAVARAISMSEREIENISAEAIDCYRNLSHSFRENLRNVIATSTH